ncbi:hypothetical protein [Pseudomonas helleri]|nr:hypothetical protein [Pseudomonas helleri]
MKRILLLGGVTEALAIARTLGPVILRNDSGAKRLRGRIRPEGKRGG